MDNTTAFGLLDESLLILERQLYAVNLIAPENKIRIFHPKGHELGFIREKLTSNYEIYDQANKHVLSAIRPNTLAEPGELEVFGPDGRLLGATHHKMGLLKQKYDVFTDDGTKGSEKSLVKFGELKGFGGTKVWTAKSSSSSEPMAEISWKHVGTTQFHNPNYHALSFVPMDGNKALSYAERATLLGTALLIDTLHFSDLARYSRLSAGQDNDGSLALSTAGTTAAVSTLF